MMNFVHPRKAPENESISAESLLSFFEKYVPNGSSQ
jgi:hypothetical protein